MAKLESKNASIDAKEEILKGFKASIKNLEKEINGKNNSKDLNDVPEIELTGKKTPQEAANLFTSIYRPIATMELDKEFEDLIDDLNETDVKIIKNFENRMINRMFETLQKNPTRFCYQMTDRLWYVDKKDFDEYIDSLGEVMAAEDKELRRILEKYDD